MIIFGFGYGYADDIESEMINENWSGGVGQKANRIGHKAYIQTDKRKITLQFPFSHKQQKLYKKNYAPR